MKPRRSTEIPDSYWGIQAGSLDERVLETAAGIGVKWTRLQASWPAIEKERGRYDWTATDRAFDATLGTASRRLSIWSAPTALYTPVIRFEDRKQAEIYGERPAPPTHNAEAMAAWLRFVEAAVTRYHDRIQYWEVWNEPNHRAYWGAPPDAREYGRLLGRRRPSSGSSPPRRWSAGPPPGWTRSSSRVSSPPARRRSSTSSHTTSTKASQRRACCAWSRCGRCSIATTLPSRRGRVSAATRLRAARATTAGAPPGD